jgi:CRISPR-associated endonuclease/helicase Cas3
MVRGSPIVDILFFLRYFPVSFDEFFSKFYENKPAFVWQKRLYQSHLDSGALPESIDVPTGLGKTSIIGLWLIARLEKKPVPRRLIYVVDRRAVVDQATDDAIRLAEVIANDKALQAALGQEDLPVYTLRGQHKLSKDWRAYPEKSAIFVGTVDMVGSRLLFNGYGCSPKARSIEAAMMGTDSLVVLDEAHLVPPFAEMMRTLHEKRNNFSAADKSYQAIVPKITFLPLSATGRQSDNSFR